MVARSGDLVGERYRLGRQIGAGGMAAVFEALDITLKRRVAAKFLTVRHRNPATVERRFLREARIAAAVRHPNVVEVYDFGVADETPYMIMELLEGASLADRTRRPPLLGLGELFDVIDGVLAGLGAVHDAGIVHRDIKPENIYLTSGADGATVPKVFDFGVSKIQTEDGPISASTSVEGYLVGTPHYMSSEQARGLKDLQPTTDVYSIGVVLYEHLTGQLPFDAELMGDLVIAIATEVPKSVVELRPEVGQRLSDLVDKAMSRLPADRFETVAEMRRELLAIREAQPELEDMSTRVVVRQGERLEETLDKPEVPLPWDDEPLEVDFGLPDPEPEPVTTSTVTPLGIRSPGTMIGAALGVVAVLAAAVVAVVMISGDGDTEPPRTAAPTATPLADAETSAPRFITVTLAGVPEGAVVRLDGTPVRSDEISLAQSDREHEISIHADGMEPFVQAFLATADRHLEVALSPVPVVEPDPEPNPAVEPTPPSTRCRRRGRANPEPDPEEEGSGIFRTPDF